MTHSPQGAVTPCLLGQLPRLASRLRDGRSDLCLVLWGDSLFAREMHTTAAGIDPRVLPPTMHSRRFDWFLWQALPLARPRYRRFDSPGAFVYTGRWQVAAGDPAWDDGPYRPGVTLVSTSAAATFTWSFSGAAPGTVVNLLHRTESGGADAVVTVSSGPGAVEVRDEDTGAWAEADGHRFTQRREGRREPRRQGNTLYPQPLSFRVRSSSPHTRATIAKVGRDADRLTLWGLETYVPGQGVLHLHNAARGSHTLEMLARTMDDDVIDRRPDLVLLELPLLNMLQVCPTVEYAVHSVHDVVWGDRPGAANDWALARRASVSARWSEFEVVLLVPHHSQAHVTAADGFADLGGVTAAEVYDGVRSLIAGKGDVPSVDMARAFWQHVAVDGRFHSYHEAVAASAPGGDTYTSDGVHQNDRGTLLYAREVCAALGSAAPDEPPSGWSEPSSAHKPE